MAELITLMDRFITLADRNPGAVHALCQLYKHEYNNLAAFDILEKMDIKGWKIHVLFKYCCENDIQKLYKIITTQSKEKLEDLIKENT